MTRLWAQGFVFGTGGRWSIGKDTRMTGKEQLERTIWRVAPITNRLVDKVDACPHEAAMLGYLLGLRRGITDYTGWTDSAPLVGSIEHFIAEVTEHGLPD